MSIPKICFPVLRIVMLMARPLTTNNRMSTGVTTQWAKPEPRATTNDAIKC